MNWYSRSAYGVLIGVLIISACIGVGIYIIHGYLNNKNNITNNTFCLYEDHLGILLVLLLFLFLTTLFSGLLIWGIIKRRHNLMVLIGLGYLCACGRFLNLSIEYVCMYVTFGVGFSFLVKELLAIIFVTLILWPVFSLYRDIKRKNNQKSSEVLNDVQLSSVHTTDPVQQHI